MGLFSRRDRSKLWHIDWGSPVLQPINGVSLETWIRVSQGPNRHASDAMAREAGVSTADWTEARIGWVQRVNTNEMAMNAMQLIMDPDVTPGRTHGA
jgi:hypothetical protein